MRSEKVYVKTQNLDGACEAECDRPLSALSRREMHEPKFRIINKFLERTGTQITIIGYNNNERSQFRQSSVKDYLLWYTKVGSIERQFDVERLKNFVVKLRCIDHDIFEEISFGHRFPSENSDIKKLFDQHGAGAADKYVKKYIWRDQRLQKYPEVVFDVVVYIEGDEVKRSYNPMIRGKSRSDTGCYKVADRYGIWLCKDYIPVKQINDWISGFGTGSNAFTLLHGFINCQKFKLTANRGDVANTNPEILMELKLSVQKLIHEIDSDLKDKGIYILREWQEEDRTLSEEKEEFKKRIDNLKNRKIVRLDDRLLIEPRSESELFGVFMIVLSARPDFFPFELLDYNTTKGIDLIARNKTGSHIIDGEHCYIELKHTLQAKRFNHAFEYLRWIVCWDFDRTILPGIQLQGIVENDNRVLRIELDEDGHHIYFLDNPLKPVKIRIIRLREFLKEQLNLEFSERL